MNCGNLSWFVIYAFVRFIAAAACELLYIYVYIFIKHTVNPNMPNKSLIYAHIYNRTVVFFFQKCNAFKFTVFNIETKSKQFMYVEQFCNSISLLVSAHTHTHPQSFVAKSQSSLNKKRANFLYKSILFRSIDGQNGLQMTTN